VLSSGQIARACGIARAWQMMATCGRVCASWRSSTIITSQLPVASWHEVIGDPTYADAILNRLDHNAHRLNLEGDSIRRLKSDPAA